MSRALAAYVLHIESMNAWLGRILKFGILVLIGTLLLEAASRTGFNRPLPWSIEFTQFVLGTCFILGAGYALLRGANIRMDLFYTRWSLKKRAIVDLVTFPLFAVYIITFLLGGIDNTAYALKFSQTTGSAWGPPLAPIKIIVLVGLVILVLQAVVCLIRDVAIVRGKPMA